MATSQSGTGSKNIPAVFGLYLLIALAVTWPLALHLGSALGGVDGRDSLQLAWLGWWFKKSVVGLGQSPAEATYLYYPLNVHFPLLQCFVSVPTLYLPLNLLCGATTAYDVAFILSFALAGLTAYLLCYRLTGQVWAAFVGGLIFAFYPNRLGQATAGHLLLINSYPAPLYLLFLLLLCRRPTVKRAFLCGFTAAWLALTHPSHAAYFLIPATALAALFWPGRLGTFSPPTARSLSHLALAAIIAGLLLLPSYGPLVWGRSLSYLDVSDDLSHATDLLAFFGPSPYHPLLNALGLVPGFVKNIIGSPREMEERLAYLGIVPLALAFLGVKSSGRRGLFWLTLALCAALLALGPVLKIGGEVTKIPLPYSLLSALPFYEWGRTPGRFNETVMLSLGVLASYGAARLLRRRAGVALVTALSALILLEYLVVFPFPLGAQTRPAYYYELSRQPIGGGILDLPIVGTRRGSNYAMYYQTIHEHPIVGGYLYRDPPQTVEMAEFVDRLVSPAPPADIIPYPSPAERRSALASMGIEQVIAREGMMTDRAARATLAFLPELLGKADFSGDGLSVYRVPPSAEPVDCIAFLEQTGWGGDELDERGPRRDLTGDGGLYIYNYGTEEVKGRIRLRVESANGPQTLQLYLRGELLASLPVDREASLETPPITIERGFNVVTFHLPGAACTAEEMQEGEKCRTLVFREALVYHDR